MIAHERDVERYVSKICLLFMVKGSIIIYTLRRNYPNRVSL